MSDTTASARVLIGWLWTNYLTDGALLPAIVHGAVIFLILAAILAWSAGTPSAWKKLLPSLPLAGVALAGVFYPIAYTIGYLPALLVTWIATAASSFALASSLEAAEANFVRVAFNEDQRLSSLGSITSLAASIASMATAGAAATEMELARTDLAAAAVALQNHQGYSQA